MGLEKKSQKSDRIADLYRAAFYLAKGERAAGLSFLEKANYQVKTKPTNHRMELILAEEVLDQYHILRFSPSG